VPRVLVKEPIAAAGVELLRNSFDVDVEVEMAAEELPERIGDYDALIVRSATRVTDELLAHAPRLKVIGRAGTGVDNVDVPAATRRGIIVANAPGSNMVSAAEHAVGLLLAMARNIPQAHAALKEGRWERGRFGGIEVCGKTLGVLGFGRIGQLVASRAQGLGMHVIAHDPFVSPERFRETQVMQAGLDELLAAADFITLHAPLTPETEHLVRAETIAKMRPGVRIVNAARGGLVQEDALADAIRSGQVAGAGIDVFVTEPATDSPLFGLPGVVVTPHLGASTVEAQDKAGLAVARSVRLALHGEFVPDAVNVQAGGTVAEEIRPGLPLAEKLGRVFTGLAGGVAQSITVEVRGEIIEHDVSVLQLAALKGVFTDVVSEQVTFVNAPLLAKDRGVDVGLATYAESEDYRNLVTVRGVLPTGETVSVSGTLTGPKQEEKLTEVDGYDVELRLEGHLLFFRYTDHPGVVGVVGARLGDAGVNIAGAQVSRTRRGGEALMVVTVDSTVPAEVLSGIGTAIGATDVRGADLDTE